LFHGALVKAGLAARQEIAWNRMVAANYQRLRFCKLAGRHLFQEPTTV